MSSKLDFVPNPTSKWNATSITPWINIDGESIPVSLSHIFDTSANEIWKRFDGFGKQPCTTDELINDLASRLHYSGDLKNWIVHVSGLSDRIGYFVPENLDRVVIETSELYDVDVDEEAKSHGVVDESGNLLPGFDVQHRFVKDWIFEYDIKEDRWYGLGQFTVNVTVGEDTRNREEYEDGDGGIDYKLYNEYEASDTRLKYSFSQYARDFQIGHFQYGGSLEGHEFLKCETFRDLFDTIDQVFGSKLPGKAEIKDAWTSFADDLRKLGDRYALDDPLDMINVEMMVRGLPAFDLGEDMLVDVYYDSDEGWEFSSGFNAVSYYNGEE